MSVRRNTTSAFNATVHCNSGARLCSFVRRHGKKRVSVSLRSQRQGAIVILVAVVMPMLLILSAFAINSASVELYHTELYCAADAASRAAGREYLATNSQTTANDTAKKIAAMNTVAGEPLLLADSDIVYGTSTRPTPTSRYEFIAGSGQPNSVKVTANRTKDSLGGPLPLFFSNVIGLASIENKQSAISTQAEVDIALVIDRSGSMAYAADEDAEYPPPPTSAPPGWDFGQPAPPSSRWRNLVSAVGFFLKEMKSSPLDSQIAIATYNDSSVTDQALTKNFGAVFGSLQPYNDKFDLGGTNIGDGIIEGANTIVYGAGARPGAVKVLIVMTDGIHNIGTSPHTAAASAASNGIQIFTITFSDEADQAAMAVVANQGGGMHFHAATAGDLLAAYEEIAKRLPVLLTK